jgi:hypothetical protein
MSLKKFFAEELREFRWVVIGSLVYWFVLKPTRAALTSGGGELGIASWYGPGYIGNKTANGETFTAKEMTAAHKTLPFNTRVRVTDVDTGRSVVVRQRRRPHQRPRSLREGPHHRPERASGRSARVEAQGPRQRAGGGVGLNPQLWMQRVCGGAIPAVLDLYSNTAVLVPTYDPGPLVGKRQLVGYFASFMSKPGLCGKIDSVVVQRIGATTVFSGLYTFAWRGGRAQARYTFVVADGKIVTHHSSEVPS